MPSAAASVMQGVCERGGEGHPAAAAATRGHLTGVPCIHPSPESRSNRFPLYGISWNSVQSELELQILSLCTDVVYGQNWPKCWSCTQTRQDAMLPPVLKSSILVNSVLQYVIMMSFYSEQYTY